MRRPAIPPCGAAALLAAPWLFGATGTAAAQGQAYPSRPIRFVVPTGPAGGVDFIARVVAGKLSDTIGQQVIVENRPGGATNIGSEAVINAPPDGYTVLLGGLPNTVNMFLFSKPPYDVVRDFAPVCHVSTAPNILVVHPSLPARSVKALIALATVRRGELTFASAGVGSSNHLSGELFRVMAGIDIVHVPYKGGGAAVTDVIAGQVTMFFGTTPSTLPHVRNGRLRALAVTTLKRSRAAPEIPTMDESGVPGFDNASWQGLFAPARTPAPVVARLANETLRVLRIPDVTDRLASQGVDVVGGGPAAMAAYIKQDLVKYAKLVKAAAISTE